MRVRPGSTRRVFVSCLFVLTLTLAAPAAAAQERPDTPRPDLRAALANPQLPVGQQIPMVPQPQERGSKRPAALLPLYASLVGLQALDIHSTRRGMQSGATRESNPLMKPFVGNDAAFIAVKASATVGTIFVTEKLRKKHPKTAVVLAVALNVGMAAVVANNYRLAR
jgi:hypothetical protein